MRTRLVPFDRLLPRLQRIVRQTSSTLNRPAELIVQNTEGELRPYDLRAFGDTI